MMTSFYHALPHKLRAPLDKVLAKNVHHWVFPWLRHQSRTLWQSTLDELDPYRPLHHLIFCFCDHFEPEWGRPTQAIGETRVKHWQENYPQAFSGFRDADGHPPQHSFFFPGEEYRRPYLDRLSELCAAGFGEVELHLHHDRDTASALRQKINDYLETLGSHGHFSREGDTKQLRYGFIHGNWALANGHPDGRECGVDDELEVLFSTGCYADFTFPSAPHPTQPAQVNRIYWPIGDLSRARAYELGEPAVVGIRHEDRLLIVEGPIALSKHPKKFYIPRIEAAAVTAKDPPTPQRVRTWVRQGISIAGRPEWIFVKVHCHGAPETQAEAILGSAGEMLHKTLRNEFNDGVRWALHYVTARELFNIACAAMDGYEGNPGGFRDYGLPPPPIRRGT